MRAIRVLFAAILFAAAGFVTPAWATAVSTDQSDLWWVPTESGWGMQLVQRGSVIFATMFVYDQGTNPIWYTATLFPTGQAYAWTGDLQLTHGGWFGATNFNQTPLTYRRVGTMTWNAQTVETGVLNYSVDGVPVTKNIQRQFLVYDDFSGVYSGSVHVDATGCSNPAANITLEGPVGIIITQSGQQFTLRLTESSDSCTLTGQLTQAGQMGTVNGSMVCDRGESGSFQLLEMQINISGITGRLTTNSPITGCRESGWFAGMRSTIGR